VAVAIDDVIDKKLAAMDVLESQFLEGGANGHAGLMPRNEEHRQQRRQQVRKSFDDRYAAIADQHRKRLIEIYGKERGEKIRYAEVFELCEYGSQPRITELLRMFPIDARRE
jgi:hypothetical protein